MKARVFSRWVRAGILGLLLMLGVLLSPAAARSSEAEQPSNGIPEDQRPWGGLPWVIGIVLAGGTVVVSLKNAKRTHMD